MTNALEKFIDWGWTNSIGEYMSIDLRDAIIEALENQIQAEADGCVGCKYEDKDIYEQPCLLCKRSKEDMWKRSDK